MDIPQIRIAYGAGDTAICDDAPNDQRIDVGRAEDVFKPRLIEGRISSFFEGVICGGKGIDQTMPNRARGKVSFVQEGAQRLEMRCNQRFNVGARDQSELRADTVIGAARCPERIDNWFDPPGKFTNLLGRLSHTTVCAFWVKEVILEIDGKSAVRLGSNDAPISRLLTCDNGVVKSVHNAFQIRIDQNGCMRLDENGRAGDLCPHGQCEPFIKRGLMPTVVKMYGLVPVLATARASFSGFA